MDQQKQTMYTVEFEMSGVVFYQDVSADSIADAKKQIHKKNPDVTIRAVSIIGKQCNEENENSRDTRCLK